MKPLYTAVVTAEGGRAGRVRAAEPPLDLPLTMPKSLGGPGGNATNPEQLFAAGYAACFESALQLVARKMRRPVEGASITAHVTLNRDDAGLFKISVELHGRLPLLAPAEAQALMEAAHGVCPYSNATRGNVEVKLVVVES